MKRELIDSLDQEIASVKVRLEALVMARSLIVAAGGEGEDDKPKARKKVAADPPASSTKAGKDKVAKLAKLRKAKQKKEPAAEKDPVPPPDVKPAPAKNAVTTTPLKLNDREAKAYDLLVDGAFVSVGAMEEIFGEGQARHQGIFNLKSKLEADGRTIKWSKADGYQMIDKGAE